MSQPFRPHVNLFFFGLEWRLSRELMALDIMTSFITIQFLSCEYFLS